MRPMKFRSCNLISRTRCSRKSTDILRVSNPLFAGGPIPNPYHAQVIQGCFSLPWSPPSMLMRASIGNRLPQSGHQVCSVSPYIQCYNSCRIYERLISFSLSPPLSL